MGLEPGRTSLVYPVPCCSSLFWGRGWRLSSAWSLAGQNQRHHLLVGNELGEKQARHVHEGHQVCVCVWVCVCVLCVCGVWVCGCVGVKWRLGFPSRQVKGFFQFASTLPQCLVSNVGGEREEKSCELRAGRRGGNVSLGFGGLHLTQDQSSLC